jgi:hypothetical protein
VRGERKSARQHNFEFGADIAGEGPHWRCGRSESLPGQGGGVRAREGEAPGHGFVERHGKRVNIRTRIGARTLDDFRSEIGDRPEDVPRLLRRERSRGGFGYPEIGELGRAVFGDEDVFWLDVAVNDGVVVCILQPRSGLDAVVQHIRLGEPPLLVQDLAQTVAVDVLHDQVVAPFVAAGVIDCDDVGVLQLRDDAGFAFEALHQITVPLGGETLAQELERDPAAEALVFG